MQACYSCKHGGVSGVDNRHAQTIPEDWNRLPILCVHVDEWPDVCILCMEFALWAIAPETSI
jgi:hypothetical protein